MRFDFASNIELDENETGTIAELLKEINQTYNPKSGELATFKSLKRTLELIEAVTGWSFPNATAPVPLSALKTIKLLFLANHKSRRHLIGLIGPVTAENRATMEFCTGTTIPRDKKGNHLINSLVDQLALEIDPTKLARLAELAAAKEMASFSEALVSHIEKTNDTVLWCVRRHITNSRDQAKVFYVTAKKIDSMHYRSRDDKRPPVHEAMYCHLITLGLQHFISHHRTFIANALNKTNISSIEEQAALLCQTLGDIDGGPANAIEQFASVARCKNLIESNYDEFNSLVEMATGLKTRKERFIQNIPIASAILASYCLRSYDEANLEAELLSIFDIVAALCSVRYQQKAGTKYPPFLPGLKSPGTSPQSMFKKGMRSNDPHQYQGVVQIYLYRFYEFQAAFTRTTESLKGWMAYQVARLDAYSRILKLGDIDKIVATSHHFDAMCAHEAEKSARSHARLDVNLYAGVPMDMEMGSLQQDR